MKNFVSLLLAIVLLFVFSCSLAEGWKGSVEVTIKSAMEKTLGDQAKEISSALEDAELGFRVNENGACVVVNDTAIAMKDATAKAVFYAMEIDNWASWLKELETLLNADTAGIAERTDIYSSLFIASRYLEPDAAMTAALLNSTMVQRLFFAAGENMTAVVDGLAAGKAELSYFVAEDAYLMLLDLSVNGEDMLIKVIHDVTGFTAALYIDANVTDWDATIAAIEDGESGRGVTTFLLGDDEESYLEVTPRGNDANDTWEITIGADKSLDVVVRADGKKFMELEGEIEAADVDVAGISMEEAASVLGDSLANAVKTVMGALEGEN